ncbi:PAS domain S-box protein [Bacteroidota bacterium]
MSNDKINILQRALAREKTARKEAESILEKKSLELYNTTQELKTSNGKLEFLLGEKDSQLKGVFENINDAYLIMDLNGNVLKINQNAEELFGYDLNKENFNVQSLIYEEDAEYAYNSFHELAKNGVFSNYTARILTKNKEIKWVQINSSIIYNQNNTPIAAQGIIRDITETKFMNEFIVEQKMQLDTIVNHSPFGIALAQLGKILKTNKFFTKLLGYTEDELLKLTLQDISHDDDLKESDNYYKKLAKGEIDHFKIEKRYKKKDGSIIWAKTNVSAVRDEERNNKYQIVIIEDITYKREQKLILDMIQNLTQSILGKSNIQEISWEITSRIANYLDTNCCSLYILNTKKDRLELGGAYNTSNKISDELSVENTFIGKVARTGKSKIENNTSNKDKNNYLSKVAVPIISEEKIIGVIESKHIDKNYFTKEHVNTLENIASLVSMQLKSAIHLRERQKVEVENINLLKKLEDSNLELQEYAHIVSHDLKSPLRSINALFSFIKEDNYEKLDNASHKNIEMIDTTLEKMEQLITDVLTYSSIEEKGKSKEKVDLNFLLEDLKKIMYLPEHISIKVLNKLPIIKTDKIKLQQLFQNLIGNAVKFSDKEKGIIEIDVIEKKDFYLFSVKDNGIGIEEKYFKKIFHIFNSLKKHKESSGIGLSIVKKIVELHGGEIWVESELNEYTTFFFTIPK